MFCNLPKFAVFAVCLSGFYRHEDWKGAHNGAHHSAKPFQLLVQTVGNSDAFSCIESGDEMSGLLKWLHHALLLNRRIKLAGLSLNPCVPLKALQTFSLVTTATQESHRLSLTEIAVKGGKKINFCKGRMSGSESVVYSTMMDHIWWKAHNIRKYRLGSDVWGSPKCAITGSDW